MNQSAALSKMNLHSGVSRELEKFFILDEDGIRRIVGILEARAKDLSHPCAVVFHVRREDDRFYETTRLEDVLSDANTPGRRIQLLRIELRNADPNRTAQPLDGDWIVAVAFSTKGNKQKIDVSSEDRNWALLLADEVEPQIVRTFVAKHIPTWLLIIFYIAITMGLISITNANTLGQFLPLSVIPTLKAVISMACIVLSAGTLEPRNRLIAKWVGPESSFHWGEQAASYNHREGIRQKLFWGVLVGFFLSVGATLYTNALFPQTAEAGNTQPQKLEPHNVDTDKK
ncbi:MAG TPA: hypothetical protein VFP33_09610 [Gallionella sp.]|nr:hypothetical protein [Gallionella sp.]